jgi:hypothetical protein
MNQQLIDFHLGIKPDDADRYITEIAAFGFEELEFTHDYIQWLFPLPEPSAYAPDVPVLDDETLAEFRKNEKLTQSIEYCAMTMMRFYYVNNHWINKDNHNYLRISRIIRCLALIGLEEFAKEFYSGAKKLVEHNEGEVSDKTLEYWEAAAEGRLP